MSLGSFLKRSRFGKLIADQVRDFIVPDDGGVDKIQGGANNLLKLTSDNGMLFSLVDAAGNTVMRFENIPGSGLFKFKDSPLRLYQGDNVVISMTADDFVSPATEARLEGGAGLLMKILADNGFILDLSGANGSTVIAFKSPGGVVKNIGTAFAFYNVDNTQGIMGLTADDFTNPTIAIIQAVVDKLMLSANELRFNGAQVDLVGLILGNYPTGGNIGTAPDTVDTFCTFPISQTTAGQTLTLPDPTTTGDWGRKATVMNKGTQSFSFYGKTVAPGKGAIAMWDGVVWSLLS